MLDLGIAIILLAFVGASWGFVLLCERLREGGA
jgi:hypothetical protein